MLRINFTGDGGVWTWGWGKLFLDYSIISVSCLIFHVSCGLLI